jgi:hypothetical protein
MPSAKSNPANAALELLAKPADFDAFLAKLAARDRQNVDRHLALADAEPEPEHGKLWRRIARSLFTLSPHAVTTIGQQALMFFVADGKYRMQVFAIEDPRDGRILVYTGDVLKEAAKAGILSPPGKGDASAGHIIGGDKNQRLLVEALDANNTPNPHPWYKNMLGWGRKALRITLPVKASKEQISAAEQLAAIYFSTLAKNPAPAPAK